jgi:hypothetical protein
MNICVPNKALQFYETRRQFFLTLQEGKVVVGLPECLVLFFIHSLIYERRTDKLNTATSYNFSFLDYTQGHVNHTH